MLAKSLMAGLTLLFGIALSAAAQPVYQPYQGYSPAPAPRRSVEPSSPVWLPPSVPVPTRPAVPPEWNYDPYTNGTVPAPQHGGE